MDPIKSRAKMVKLGNEVIGINFKTKGGFFVCTPSINWVMKKKYEWQVESGWETDFKMSDWVYDLLIFGNINEEMEIIKKSNKPSYSRVSTKETLNFDGERRDSTLAESHRTVSNTPKEYFSNLLDIFPIEPEWTQREEWLRNGMAIHTFVEFRDPLTIKLWSIYSSKNPNTFDRAEIEMLVPTFKADQDNALLGL